MTNDEWAVIQKLQQKSIEQAVREKNGESLLKGGAIENIQKPDVPQQSSYSPSVSFLEILYASIVKRMEQTVTAQQSNTTQQKGTSMLEAILNIVKVIVLGKSPVTSWIGVIGFILSVIGDYVLNTGDLHALTIGGFIFYLSNRFSQDVQK